MTHIPRVRLLATKGVRQPEQILDSYPWKEPKAKCIIKSKPSEELINPRSPKPIFYRDSDDPNKSYMIITPHQTPRYDLSNWVYKYNIEQDEYKKIAKYPKDFEIDFPMHVFDENKQTLHIFDSRKKGKDSVKWELDFKSAKWEKKSIRLNQNCLFFARNVRSTMNQNGIKVFDIGRGSVQTFDFHRMNSSELNYPDGSFEDGQLVFFERQNKMLLIGQAAAFIYDSSTNDAEEPPMKKRKLNGDNCSRMELERRLDFTDMKLSKNVDEPPVFNRFMAFLKHEYIVFVFNIVGEFYPWVNSTDRNMDIWCLDLFNDSYKWYKSEKRLPQCLCYTPHAHSKIFKNFIHETDNEYVHFMHHSLDHVMIDTVDLVPDELKNIHRRTFEFTVYGYVREQIDIIKFDKHIPVSLRHLILHFFTHFG